jgi:hypothetical protein
VARLASETAHGGGLPAGEDQAGHQFSRTASYLGKPRRHALMVVAKNLGHSDTRMVEKHYGHLAPSYIADAIRAGAPRFGFKPDPKLATLGG